MQTRTLGRTGLAVSALGYGCGAVGGLMVRGDQADQERAVARAIEHGITYFDTAPQYGDGASETNLGRVLRTLGADVVIGTKVRVASADRGRLAAAIPAALEASLRRLGRDSVHLYQLHNAIGAEDTGETLGVRTVLDEIAPAFARLREAGKLRFFGITAIGETDALHAVIESRAFDTAQVSYNMLNPSAGATVPSGYPAQDYGNLIGRAQAAGMGLINIRVLAGGALSGSGARHPVATPRVDPIGSGRDYATDVERARRLSSLVEAGEAGDLVEAALRFAVSNPAIGTILVGTATIDELEKAVAAVNKGALSDDAMRRLAALQAGFAGEPR